MKPPPREIWRWGECHSVSPCFGSTDEVQHHCLDGEGHLCCSPHRSHAFEEHFEGLALPLCRVYLPVLQFRPEGKLDLDGAVQTENKSNESTQKNW